jgi:purine-binding chemotaxis protein CheW
MNRQGPIDWEEVRRRLERAARATREAGELTPEQALAVLDRRARRLAEVPPAPPAADRVEVLVFRLGEERYALPTDRVLEVARPGEPTPVPGAPEVLAGVVNLRGEVLPVFDLGQLLRREKVSPGGRARLLVLGEDRPELAALVDEVEAVTLLDEKEVHPGDRPAPPVRGVTPAAVAVLDGAALLRDERLVIDMRDEGL